jgi:uncharacterized protein (TIGR03083 family)
MPDLTELLDLQATSTRKIIRSVSDADMAKESPGCPGWTVKDVVAHLTTGAQMFDAVIRGTLDSANWIPERERRLAENSALSPSELRNRCTEADEQFVATFKSLSPEELKVQWTHPALGRVPVERFLFMRLGETAIHGWDVKAACQADAKLEAPAAPGVLQGMLAFFPEWCLSDKLDALRRIYRFDTGSKPYTLVIAEGKAAWADSDAPADATLKLDTGDFLLMLTGRLSSDQLITSGRAQASGDVQAAKDFSTLFKAYGGR